MAVQMIIAFLLCLLINSQSFSPVLHTNSQNWMELWRVTESIRHSTTMTDGKDYVTTADDVRLAVGKLFFS